MSRGRIITLIAVPTIVLVTAVAVVVLLMMQASDRREQVVAADKTAAEYIQAVDVFKQEAEAAAYSADFSDPEAVGTAVSDAAETLPELGDATEHGVENSTAYRDAEQLQETTSQSLETFQEAVEESVQLQEFVAEAERIMEADPTDHLSATTFANGKPVRDRMLPPMEKALAQAEALKAPESAETAERARKQIVEAARRMVRGVKKLASELDAGRSYNLRYGFGGAPLAVNLVSGQAQSDLREAVEVLVGDGEQPEGDEPEEDEPEGEDPDGGDPDGGDDTQESGTGV